MENFFLSIVVNVVVLAAWGTYFYRRHTRRQSFAEIVKIFILGTLSIVAVWLFHQWLLKEVLVEIKSIWSVFSYPFVSAVLELLLLLLFIFSFIFLFSFLHSLMLKIFYQLPWKQSFKAIYKRIYNVAPILVFFVIFLVLEAVLNLTVQESFVLSIAGSTIVFAVLEEYFKYIINPFLVYKKIDSIRTAMIHAIYVGMAFAFIENLLFFHATYTSPDFLNIVIYRALFTTLLHVGVSGLLGYFYGVSLFAESMLTNYEIEKTKYDVPFWLKGLLQKNVAFQSVAITQGFFLAALFHALFNLLLHLDMVKLAAGFSLLLTATVIFLLNSKTTKIQYGLIGDRVMPLADFEKLRLQISVLEHVKEIQKSRTNFQ